MKEAHQAPSGLSMDEVGEQRPIHELARHSRAQVERAGVLHRAVAEAGLDAGADLGRVVVRPALQPVEVKRSDFHRLEHRREIGEILKGVNAILIAGGHVAIILNRLKIFGILNTQQELPIIAWSGGAMALSDQVVFFHDSPPQGPGDPEVLRAGMGIFQDVLPLPDAQSRLNLEDQARVELFARRFEHFQCVLFDDRTILERSQGVWTSTGSDDAMRLGTEGSVVNLNA